LVGIVDLVVTEVKISLEIRVSLGEVFMSVSRQNASMRVPAKVDYGVRALLQLTDPNGRTLVGNVKAEDIAVAEDIPIKFLEGILRQLRLAGLVTAQRGSDGGYRLGKEPSEISVADVIRAIDGPLAEVRGLKPEDLHYEGPSENLVEIWVALRASMREVLEKTTLEDIRNGKFNAQVRNLNAVPGAWERR
jgi:Rrf2 family protein